MRSIRHCVLVILVIVRATNLCEGYVTYIAARLPLQGNRSAPGAPWPMPQIWQQNSEVLSMDPSQFTMESDLEECKMINQSLERYRRLVFFHPEASLDDTLVTLKGLKIQITNETCEKYPRQDSDEYYELKIDNPMVTLKTHSIWGVLRGLETFSQLIYISSDRKYHVNVTNIRDWPRFPYRGLLVDTARHYIPMSILLQNLDAMAYNKLNVMHWHIVDDQSFPYVSVKFPELSQKGAYSPRHIYSQADVARVIEFARLRGIRVIPEFDTPGHTQSWGKAFPGTEENGKLQCLGTDLVLMTPCWVDGEPYRAAYGKHATSENFDPTKNKTYEFMKEFLGEIVEVFKDDYIDLGMDEAHYYCWQSSPNISAFMAKQGFQPDEYFKLEQVYSTKVIDIARSLGTKVYIYQDPIDHGAQVQNDTVIRIWKGKQEWQSYAENVTKAGYHVIISSCWYLNYISYGQDWRKYYLCEPFSFQGTPGDYGRVLGGEASIWAEYVDGTNILQTLWPRLSAVAERLWSAADVRDADSATFRLDEQRCRLRRRGIPAQPILGGNCGEYDFETEVDKNSSRSMPLYSVLE